MKPAAEQPHRRSVSFKARSNSKTLISIHNVNAIISVNNNYLLAILSLCLFKLQCILQVTQKVACNYHNKNINIYNAILLTLMLNQSSETT
jgi:hypothetical protein